MKWWAVLLILLIPGAAAGSADTPELTDPAGDQSIRGAPIGIFGRGMDLHSVWFTDDADGLHATIHVEDLAALLDEPGQAQADAIFAAMFELDHADKSGPGGRNGEWTLRADYLAGNPRPWSYRGEGPCLDGDDADGCAGADRDIIESLSGHFDLEASTVTITLPWHYLAPIAPGDGIKHLRATTQFVYPAWPLYTVDWDTDQRASSEYRYTSATTSTIAPALATEPEVVEATGPYFAAMVLALIWVADRRPRTVQQA